LLNFAVTVTVVGVVTAFVDRVKLCELALLDTVTEVGGPRGVIAGERDERVPDRRSLQGDLPRDILASVHAAGVSVRLERVVWGAASSVRSPVTRPPPKER